ncbi:hypothetical protein FOZ62_006776 [Perkinsus olseni]|uniref:Uncharacterized protein n=1 Tax=Perkinsus olseni TaxID=32597 RepID=A0A7J6RYR8_PEROL|nr:hypothetical protein FOZ62_006776 [Perkinsus olseni]
MSLNPPSYSANGYAHRGPPIPDYHSGGFFFGGVRYKSQYGSMLMQPFRVKKKAVKPKLCTTPVTTMAALHEVNSEYRSEMRKRYNLTCLQALMLRHQRPSNEGKPGNGDEEPKLSNEASHLVPLLSPPHRYKSYRSRRGSSETGTSSPPVEVRPRTIHSGLLISFAASSFIFIGSRANEGILADGPQQAGLASVLAL